MNMEEAYLRAEIEDSIFYRECKSAFKGSVIKLLGINLIAVFAFGLLVLLPVYAAGGASAVIASAIIFAAADALVLAFLIIRKKKLFKSFVDNFYSFSAIEFKELCRQSRASGLKYDTLFLLENFIVIPQELLIIPYSDINRVFAMTLSQRSLLTMGYRNTQLRITLNNNKTYKIEINRPDEFLDDFENFLFSAKKTRIY